MPLPMPHDGEEQDKFMARCMTAMEDETGELKDAPHKQRVAVCMSQWKTKKMQELDAELEDATSRYLNEPHFSGVIIKSDKESHFVLAPVLVPGEADHQGDVVTAEEIQKCAHLFMSEIKERESDADLMHRIEVSKDDVAIVESYLAPIDMEVGGHAIAKGTWMLGMQIVNDTIWKMIDDGILKGFSIFGVGNRKIMQAEPT